MPSSKSIRETIVSSDVVQRSIELAESVFDDKSLRSDIGGKVPAALLKGIKKGAKALADAATDWDPEVLISPQNETGARLQSVIAESRLASDLAALVTEGAKLQFARNDLIGWARTLLHQLHPFDKHELLRPKSSVPENFPDKGRVALIGDWGTGLYGAPVIARTLEEDAEPFAMIMHLGDVYYAGTSREVHERFLDLWPDRPEAIHRAINSNHEMYSGGHAYFQETFQAFRQPSSYFAFANKHWILVGLDVAYVDHDVDEEQVKWIEEVLSNAPDRRVILFSHQQLFSQLETQGKSLKRHLKPLLKSGRVAAWYWGHEHHCILYDRHPKYGFLARCIGHGGMPYRRSILAPFPVEERVFEDVLWRRLSGKSKVPPGLVLDGPNEYIHGKEEKYGPHGYATLEFNGPELIERVHNTRGRVLYEDRVD